jgi:hypothetical protein
MAQVWQIVAASVAIAACASSCWGDRPLRRPKERDAGRSTDARDAVIDRETNAVDVDAHADLSTPDANATDAPVEGVACPDDDRPCCGMPGLPCCRGDCWIGVCADTDAPRVCVACGQVGQPCCRVYIEPSCESGATCEQAPGTGSGVCVPAS